MNPFNVGDKVQVFVPHLGYRDATVIRTSGKMCLCQWDETGSAWYHSRQIDPL